MLRLILTADQSAQLTAHIQHLQMEFSQYPRGTKVWRNFGTEVGKLPLFPRSKVNTSSHGWPGNDGQVF